MMAWVLLFVLVFTVLAFLLLGAVHRAAPGLSGDRLGMVGCGLLGLALVGALLLMRPIAYYGLGGAQEERLQREYREVVERAAEMTRVESPGRSEADDGSAAGILVIRSGRSGGDNPLLLDASGMSRVAEDLQATPSGRPRFVVGVVDAESVVGQRYGAGAGPITEHTSFGRLFELPSRRLLRSVTGPSRRLWNRGLPDNLLDELIGEAVCREGALRQAAVRLQIVHCTPCALVRLPLPSGLVIRVWDVRRDDVGRATSYRMTLLESGRQSAVEIGSGGELDGPCGPAGASVDHQSRTPCSPAFYRASVDGARVPVLGRTPVLEGQASFGVDSCPPEVFGATSSDWHTDRTRFAFGGLEHEIVCQDVSRDTQGQIAGYRATVVRGVSRPDPTRP
jgi:hypothetical protein